MSASPESQRQYPVACPSCVEVKGYPYQVKTLTEHPGSIEVKLRCRGCQHEWLEIVTSHE